MRTPIDDPGACRKYPRRHFMADAAKALLGVGCTGYLNHSPAARLAHAAMATSPGKAKSVIYLYMSGGMSHLDTFDPKPGADSQGDTQPAQTRLPGVLISNRLPKLAYLMNGIALIRSMTTETGAHEQGQYVLRTSYRQLNSIRHPGLGAWTNHVFGKRNARLPGNVLVGSAAGHPGSGFLPASIAPVPIPNPQAGLENTQPPSYVTDEQFRRRMSLAMQLDAKFKTTHDSALIDAYDATYKEALKLMSSSELQAFDISKESEKVREFYGNNKLGQGCLLARRLVEHGVRFVEVEYGGWDHHNDIYDRLPEMSEVLDNALGALLRDLASKGMLGEVLVVLATEFGRTPKINENAGRDHHPGAFSALLCGAGIRGGQVYGKSDDQGASVEEDGVYPEDLNATIAAAMGLPLDEEFYAPNGRPFRICNNGTPIKELLA
ncbi:MAG: DUF1501 domain-containing protein [Planctomycetota bacterium]|nr:MAG: DUF1501 domain-containing protein [Planctomycetota bacterium]